MASYSDGWNSGRLSLGDQAIVGNKIKHTQKIWNLGRVLLGDQTIVGHKIKHTRKIYSGIHQ